MSEIELRNPQDARTHLLQGLWLQRTVRPLPVSVQPVLEWALELAGQGGALPPLGFISDVGHLASGSMRDVEFGAAAPPGFDAGLLRSYEDNVLGRLLADPSFDRGADALLRYQGRDRVKGLAFLLERLRQRAGIGGVHVSPAVIRSLLLEPPAELLAAGWQSLEEDGPLAEITQGYRELVTGSKAAGDALGSEDVFELERGTALQEFSQRLALRQILACAGRLGEGLVRYKPRVSPKHRQIATRLTDADAYPVGGFVSVSNRGSVESMLHSQLAYMEADDRPDLFDIKYLRDELLYYSRDDNQFLRRRRTFVFALLGNLSNARVKDRDMPWQRIVLVLGLLLAMQRKLAEWLGNESLVFEFLLVDEHGEAPLDQEQTLLATLLGEQIASGQVRLQVIAIEELARRADGHARTSLCQLVTLSTRTHPMETELASLERLQLDGDLLRCTPSDGPAAERPIGEWASWPELAKELLEVLV